MANDSVVVRNYAPDCAYYGEINASLAVLAGVVAAVIGGARDSAAVGRHRHRPADVRLPYREGTTWRAATGLASTGDQLSTETRRTRV